MSGRGDSRQRRQVTSPMGIEAALGLIAAVRLTSPQQYMKSPTPSDRPCMSQAIIVRLNVLVGALPNLWTSSFEEYFLISESMSFTAPS